ncbi:JmjC domain [Sesbania bispinosa]|nr:JmjC domain [Sesbania bispinosa]
MLSLLIPLLLPPSASPPLTCSTCLSLMPSTSSLPPTPPSLWPMLSSKMIAFVLTVNLWIGTQHSQTSFHKDHYENLYVVVTGEKHFLLLPPTDVDRLYIRDYPAATYTYSSDTGEFDLELEKQTRYVPWFILDPYPSLETMHDEMSKFPLYFNGPRPFECTVKAGEVLYL